MPEISIIVITFNSKDFITSCLDSVFGQTHQNFEVIVIDNSSEDNTVDFIKENYPELTLIENKQNLGTCKARNQGIEIAQGEWILTLDCDVILEKDFLEKITSFAKESEKTIGIFQPKILKNDKKTIYSCGIYLSKLRRFYDIGKGRPDNEKFDKAGYIFGACSAAALYRRQMLDQIREETGYFDERFFFLVEDVDLSWRAQRKGWKALYCPGAVCCHFGNSSYYDRKIRQYLCFRNRYLMILKNDYFKQHLRNIPFMATYEIARLFYLFFINRQALGTLREIAYFSPRIIRKKIIEK